MGLDIYSGRLTPYYSGDWETLAQQVTEEESVEYTKMDANGDEIQSVEDNEEMAQLREALKIWADNFAANVNPPLSTPLWDESTDCGYYTDKPDWEAYWALVTMMAYLSMDKRGWPEFVEVGWDAIDEPVVKEAMSKKTPNSLLMNSDLWLPIANMSIYSTVLPTGDEGTISTVSLLKQELEELNRKLWKADEDTILSWRDDKYYVPVKQKKPLFSFLSKKTPKEKFRTEDLAQCAFSILYLAVRFAEKHNVPIVLDY